MFVLGFITGAILIAGVVALLAYFANSNHHSVMTHDADPELRLITRQTIEQMLDEAARQQEMDS